MSDSERERLVEVITDALVDFDREQHEGYGVHGPFSDRLARIVRVNDAQHAAHAVLRYYAERTQVGDCGNASPGNRLAMSGCGTTSHCSLPFGHEGWHRDARTGSRWGKEWSDPPGGVWESTPAPSVPLDALKQHTGCTCRPIPASSGKHLGGLDVDERCPSHGWVTR